MDRYDVLFCLSKVVDIFEKLKSTTKRDYYKAQKEWLSMEYYKLRTKRSSEYAKKHGGYKPVTGGIEKVVELKRNQKYAWQVLKPMEKSK